MNRLLLLSPASLRAALFQGAGLVQTVYLLVLAATASFDPHWVHGVVAGSAAAAFGVAVWVHFCGTESAVFRGAAWLLTIAVSTLVALTIQPTMLGLSLLTIAVAIGAMESPRPAITAAALCGACGTLVMWQRSTVPVTATLIFLTMLTLACSAVVILREFWRHAHDEALLLAHTDPLTELSNRRGMDAGVQELHAAAHRNGQVVGCLIVDLDSFKSINDRHGHSAGDAVLRATGRTIRESTRTLDVCARIGGEEFAVFACVEDAAELAVLAERIRRAIETQAGPHPVTASIGGALTADPAPMLFIETAPGDTPSDASDRTAETSLDFMLNTADKALYRAKAAGRNLVDVA